MRFWEKVAVFCICIVFSTIASVRADMVDRTVAIVNGEIILYSDLQEHLKLMAKLVPAAAQDLQDPTKKNEIEHDILKQMIRQKLAEQEAKRLKITINSAEVETQVKAIMEQNHATPEQFEYMLKWNGETLEKFKDGVKKDLERNRLMERAFKSKVVITDAQVDAYMKGEQGEIASSKSQVRLGLIFLPVNAKTPKQADVEKNGRDLLSKLKGGADFRRMAMEYSQGPSASDGGDIGFIAPEELAPYLAKGIKDLKSGEISELVAGPNGYYLLKVLEVKRQAQDKSDPTLREKIRFQLQQKEENRKFDEWVRELESKAFIQVTL
jgi:peptidyl-prolyl cis-trans isomerase SurA